VRSGELCYPPCSSGSTVGVGPVCWRRGDIGAPAGFQNLCLAGVGYANSQEACGKMLAETGKVTGMVLKNLNSCYSAIMAAVTSAGTKIPNAIVECTKSGVEMAEAITQLMDMYEVCP
jgi:hypothetical protein